jgi:hypothetical protein
VTGTAYSTTTEWVRVWAMYECRTGLRWGVPSLTTLLETTRSAESSSISSSHSILSLPPAPRATNTRCVSLHLLPPLAQLVSY